MSHLTKIIVGGIGTALMMIFVLGLAQSISTGFAGFWGGLPFLCIAVFVICLALYDYWEECIRDKKD
jgi:hypothetical protein